MWLTISSTHSVLRAAASSSSTSTSLCKTGRKHFELGGLDGGVIGVLYLLEQFAIIVKKARDAFFENQFTDDADREMGFAYSDGTYQ